MQRRVYITLFFTGLGLFACKKDSGIMEPAALQDFSGLYRLEGNIEIQSNPLEIIPMLWVVTARDQEIYQVGAGGLFNSSAYRWTVSGIYSNLPGHGKFRLIVYGGQMQGNNLSDAHWTIDELNSIFQPGQELSFGSDFGQVEIQIEYLDKPYGEYWSFGSDNIDRKVKIEEVNDLEIYYPERKWVKQVVVSFGARLNRVFADANASPDIELTNCRASLLFSPNVE